MPPLPGPPPPRRPTLHLLAPLAVLGVLLVGCVPDAGPTSVPAGTASDGATGDGASGSDTTPEAVPCVLPLDGPVEGLADGEAFTSVGPDDPGLDAAGIALLHVDPMRAGTLTLGGTPTDDPSCGSPSVVAPAGDPSWRTLAAATAALDGAPLVLTTGTEADGARAADEATADELLDASLMLAGRAASDGQVAALVVVLAEDVTVQADVVAHVRSGSIPLTLPEDTEAAQALLVALLARDLPVGLRWAASSLEHSRALTTLLDDALAPDGGGDSEAGVPRPERPERPERWQVPDVLPVIAGEDARSTELWLGDVRDPAASLQAAVAAATRGTTFVAVDGGDLRSGRERSERMRTTVSLPTRGTSGGTRSVVLVGTVEEHTVWQLSTVLTGTPLPTGGFLPLEEQRIVALYGSPGAPSLGLLGRQDAAATIALAREYAAGYADAVDGRTVVPGLDMIVTIASSNVEPTGDYSRRVPIARLRELVDLAREEGVAVLIDLQPGRTDFLTQAREYEELLREPHVHLALDPEWRIGPTERHLVRIGSVEAAEVQEVADWLAGFVREERLPQKVLMLHQFRLDMLPDRDTIVIPPELVGVVHIDGKGPLPAKDRTYRIMAEDAAEQWQWGWKNFTRFDEPLATPERSLARTPIPVIITYQ